MGGIFSASDDGRGEVTGGGTGIGSGVEGAKETEPRDCQELLQNSLFSPNFFLTLIIYGLLSYSVRLRCANIHIHLPFLSYPYDFQTMKTRYPDLF